jgi:cyclopropane fatty-acyl-phospholipid synthase-like methyltransferase
MNRLREALITQYTDHYSCGKPTVHPQAMAAPLHRQLQLTYGELLSDVPAGSRILDLGCGTGYLLSWLSTYTHIHAVGVDSSISQTQVARDGLPAVEVLCEEALPYLRRHCGQFAAIFCLDVLEHIAHEELLELMETVRETLNPGGFFVCKVPNAANLTAAQLRYIDLTHERSFTESSLLQLLNAAGFRQCRLIPVRAPHLSGRARLQIERALHRGIFRICGDSQAQVFTRTLSMVGYAPR